MKAAGYIRHSPNHQHGPTFARAVIDSRAMSADHPRSGWDSSFPDFRSASPSAIRDRPRWFVREASPERERAWSDAIPPLQKEVDEVLVRDALARDYSAILEYELPLESRRPDVVLLVGDGVLVVEPKGKLESSQADIDQALGGRACRAAGPLDGAHAPAGGRRVRERPGGVEGSPHAEPRHRDQIHHAKDLHAYVAGLLAAEPAAQLRSLAERLEREGFHWRLTRSLDTAKDYLRERYRDDRDARFGLIASSKDRDLVHWGVPNDYQSTKRVKLGPWYGDGEDDFRNLSCRHLDVCVTEFGAQGLEVDATLLACGTDLALEHGWWSNAKARGYKKGAKLRDPRQLRINAYRVLLTRARRVRGVRAADGGVGRDFRIPSRFRISRTLAASLFTDSDPEPVISTRHESPLRESGPSGRGGARHGRPGLPSVQESPRVGDAAGTAETGSRGG